MASSLNVHRVVDPVVEAFPGSQLFVEIDVISIGEQLVELLLVGSMRPFNLVIELRRARLDVDVFHALFR